MSLQDLGSIGELIAALATVATLVYLAVQVRHNSRALDRSNEFARANSIHELTVLFNELNWRLASDGELADIYTRALAGGKLSATEATRFVAFVNTYIATIENLVGQQSLELGYSELDSAAALDLLAPVVGQLLETTDGARWWREIAPHLYVEEFRRQVDAAVQKARASLAQETLAAHNTIRSASLTKRSTTERLNASKLTFQAGALGISQHAGCYTRRACARLPRSL